jgi:hypothetical protein
MFEALHNKERNFIHCASLKHILKIKFEIPLCKTSAGKIFYRISPYGHKKGKVATVLN